MLWDANIGLKWGSILWHIHVPHTQYIPSASPPPPPPPVPECTLVLYHEFLYEGFLPDHNQLHRQRVQIE